MVLEKLKNVIDPELFVNIVDLGLIYEIKFNASQQDGDQPADEGAETTVKEAETTVKEAETGEGTRVQIDMTMTSPTCPAGPQLINGAKKEVGSIDGVADVEVKIVLDPPWTPDRMTEDAKDQLGIF
jgi:metal-sulfur cluster biosynthetic enzyme